MALASADALESVGIRLEPADEPVTTEAPKRLRDERVGSARRAVGGPGARRRRCPPTRPRSRKNVRALGPAGAPRRRRLGGRGATRLRLFAAPRDLDGGDDDADVVLDAALTRVMHAGTYEFVEDTSEPNRVFSAPTGELQPCAISTMIALARAAAAHKMVDGAERIRNNATHCKIHLSLGRYNLQGSVSSRGGDAVEGVVLEGASDPDFVGRFRLALTSRAAPRPSSTRP